MEKIKRKRTKWTPELFKKYVREKTNDEYELVGEYEKIRTREKALFRHNRCGKEEWIGINSFIQGTRCPTCNGNKKKTTAEYKEEVFQLVGDEYEVLEEYVNTGTPILMKHSCGNEYKVSPNNFLRGKRCNLCSRIDDGNKLSEVRQDLLKEWDYERNVDISPNQVGCGSSKSVWWICEKGHPYEMKVGDKTRDGRCPYCKNLKVLEGFNDLETTHPGLAKQWHPTLNGDLTPRDVIKGQKVRVYWECELGHEWDTLLSSRSENSGCPICKNQKIVSGINDLATKNKELASEWDYERNGDLLPTQFSNNSDKKVNWIGKCGHRWKATIQNRNNGTGCPYCNNHSVLTGFNDLTITHPQVAKRWDFKANGELKPTDVLAGSDRKVWFRCDEGHSFNTRISNVAIKNTGCHYCKNKKVLKGFNDLETKFPDVAKQWNYEKNKGEKPSEIIYSSEKKYWWKCENGHEWEAMVCGRTIHENQCPKCKQSKGERYVKECLDYHGLINTQQYRIAGCRNELPLPFDSAVLNEAGDLLCLIEFDGEQHFSPIEQFGGEEGFEKTKQNDKIKNDYCEDNEIILIRIPYWRRDYVDDDLTYWLKYYQII